MRKISYPPNDSQLFCRCKLVSLSNYKHQNSDDFINPKSASWTEDKMVFELRGSAIGNYFSFKNIGSFGYVSDGKCNEVVSATFGNDALFRLVFTK